MKGKCVLDFDDVHPIHISKTIKWPTPRKRTEERLNNKVTTTYNAKGQLRSRIQHGHYNSSTDRIDYDYDSFGRLAFKSDPCVQVAEGLTCEKGTFYTYDAFDRRLTQRHTADGDKITFYHYDDSHNTVTITTPSGKTAYHYQRYDSPERGFLVKIAAPEGVTIAIERDWFGKLKPIKNDGLMRTYEYNANPI